MRSVETMSVFGIDVAGFPSSAVIVALIVVILFLLGVITDTARGLVATAASALSGAARLAGSMIVTLAVLAAVVFVLTR